MNNPLLRRRAGVLLHPTSLPSGKIDNDAIQWLDFMQSAGLSVWQVLPLGVPQHNLSPYLCYSAFALNPALLSAHDTEPVDETRFEKWKAQQAYWLADYADYCVLKQRHDDAAWYTWPVHFKDRQAEALQTLRAENEQAIDTIYQQQYQLDQRWQFIKAQAKQRNISLFGDMPIFVAHDSADVWANRDCFLLDEQGQPDFVAGVPPDYFSETGQRWGNPHYHWQHLTETGFEWWLQRMQHHFHLYDIVRIDHFRGLQAVWMIHPSCPTAVEGYWQEVPGEALLTAIKQHIGDAVIVAEDLGVITPEVTALREQFELPGMSVLQFSFDGFEDNPHKPENITANRIVYTGTHDNDTTLGWYNALEAHQQDFVYERLRKEKPTNICTAMINEALSTKAALAVIPLQDFLQLDTASRMNTPGIAEGNWSWRFDWQDLPDNLSQAISQMIQSHQRNGDALT
ncbi:MAG: 4-alpha-glucanotransferase [Leucothrix sp.]